MLEQIVHLGLVDDDDIELDKAALEIAALDHPGADLGGYLDLLETIGARLQTRAADARSPIQQAARLSEVLADDFGFEGDRATYDDPANADLISVMDRRRGLPIALSILYVALARRMGWSAYPLNTPAHVLVAVGEPQRVVLDPFNRGAIVAPRQLASFLKTAVGEGAVSQAHVEPMTNRAALVRLLMNQVTRAEAAHERDRALTLLQRINAFAPGHSLAWWRRARLEQAAGDVASARQSLTSMLETTRDRRLRAQVTRALAALAN